MPARTLEVIPNPYHFTMTNPNLQAFKPSDSVTPTKWRGPDGKVYERTGEKRQPTRDEFVWLNTEAVHPYQFVPPVCKGRQDRPCEHCGFPDRAHNLDGGILFCPVPVTPIWKLSDDQSWQPPAAPELSQPETIDSLVRQVSAMYTAEQLGPVDPLTKMQVLGVLYQAKQLERIANSLGSLCAEASVPEGLQGTGSREAGIETPAGDVIRSLARFPYMPGDWVCPMCKAGEHTRCAIVAYDGRCNCGDCNLGPVKAWKYKAPNYGAPHRFEGMEDNHFCTKCGGGRLHAIHQV